MLNVYLFRLYYLCLFILKTGFELAITGIVLFLIYKIVEMYYNKKEKKKNNGGI